MLVHNADRRSVFALSSEFEDMRKRMEHLRQHPDLSHLEPELLELAAQMSHHSRDIARVYSVERVERAKAFLKQRQEEVAQTQERLKLARHTCDELRRWSADIEAGERSNTKGCARWKMTCAIFCPRWVMTSMTCAMPILFRCKSSPPIRLDHKSNRLPA